MPEKLKSDPLQLLLQLFAFYWLGNHRRAFKILVIIFTTVTLLIEITSFVEVIIPLGLSKGFPYFLILYLLSTGQVLILVVFCFYDKMTDFINKLNTSKCTLSSGSNEVQENILSECKVVNVLFLFITLLTVIATVSLLPFQGDEETFFAPYVLVRNYFKQYYMLVNILLMTPTLVIFGFATNVVPCITLYVTLHMKFQLDILIDLLEHNIKNAKTLKEDKEVYIKLRECAVAYEDFQTMCQQVLDPAKYILIIVYVTGVPTVVSAVAFIYLGYSPQSNWRMVLALIICVFVAFTTCLAGQAISDRADDYHYLLYDCPWYEWNLSNQKMLLIMLTNGVNPPNISSFGMLVMNKEHIVTLWQGAYSTFSMAMNFK